MIDRDQVIKWAIEHADDDDEKTADEIRKAMEKDVDITSYIIIGCSAVLVLTLLFAMFYRCSVSARKSEYVEELLHQERYEKMAKEIDQAQKRNEEKRKQFEDKYGIQKNNSMT